MPSMFQPGIPTGTVFLDVDYKNIQDNFQQLDTSFGVDHKKFSDQTNFNGYHQVIHLANNSTTSAGNNNYPPSVPTPIPGASELYSSRSNDSISADSNLTFQSANGNNVLLTRNFQPLPLPGVGDINNGRTFLPGGMILQWGFKTLGGNFDTVDVSFAASPNNINFPNYAFVAFAQVISKSTSVVDLTSAALVDGSLNKLGVTFQYVGKTGNFTGLFWIAIGN